MLHLCWLARRTDAEFDRLAAATLRDIGMTKIGMRRHMQAEREALPRRLRHVGASRGPVFGVRGHPPPEPWLPHPAYRARLA